MKINCQECNGRGAYDVDGKLKSCKTCDATGRVECPCETNQKQLKEQKQTKTAAVSARPVDSKGRHLYYSFLAEKFDWVRFISDFYADDLKWAVIEKPTEITFVTRDLDFFNKIRQQLDMGIAGFSGMLSSYQRLKIDRQEIILWHFTKDKLRPLLKILRAQNKKRFSVHCGYEND